MGATIPNFLFQSRGTGAILPVSSDPDAYSPSLIKISVQLEPLHRGDIVECPDLSVRFCLLRGKYFRLLHGLII